MSESTGLISMEQAIEELDQIAKGGSLGAVAALSRGGIKTQLMLAQQMQRALALLTDDVVGQFMPLMGNPLGFVTDKDKGSDKYDIAVVRNVMAQALICGASMTGNEVNIIASRCYLTKNFYERAVREYPGVSDVVIKLSIPAQQGESAAVGAIVTLKLNGEHKDFRYEKTETFDNRIPVRVNAGQGYDAILGKATRKAYHRVYQELSGLTIPESDNDDLPPNTVETTAQPAKRGRSKTEELASAATGGAEPAVKPESMLVADHKQRVLDAKDVAEVEQVNVWMLAQKPSKEERDLCLLASRNRKAELLKGSGTLL